jgi:NAD-dependent deacetylase
MAKVIILSGAGISAESGISTFRDSDGLWENYDIKDICNDGCLETNYHETIEFYDKRREDIKDKQPNYAHKKIAELKDKYPNDIAILTQNVDDMFEKANCKGVLHLHGFLKELRCMSCDTILNIGYEKQDNLYNCCPKCNGKIRPNIVFFGEAAPMYEMLNHHIQDCKFLVIIGTSGNVIGVNTMASFIETSILNNLDVSDAIDESVFSKVLYKKASVAIDEIVEDIKLFLDN